MRERIDQLDSTLVVRSYNKRSSGYSGEKSSLLDGKSDGPAPLFCDMLGEEVALGVDMNMIEIHPDEKARSASTGDRACAFGIGEDIAMLWVVYGAWVGM
jgi:hypothetical protein